MSTELVHPAFRRVLGAAPGLAALEDVEGTPLAEHLARVGQGDATRLVIELLRALASLHAAGFAHGDLKPEHVLVEPDGAVRLIDLGLSARLGELARGGTHGYLAPELLSGAPLSVASDLFALGATLRVAGASRWPKLAALSEAACAVDPAARPSSAHAALLSLGALAAGEPARVTLPEALRATFGAAGGALLRVDVPPGGGASAVAREISSEALRRGRTAIVLPGPSPWRALAALLDASAPSGELRAAKVAWTLADDGRPIVIDGGQRLDEDEVAATLAAARALASSGRGSLFVVGATAELAAGLDALGARAVAVLPATPAEVKRLLASEGAPHGATAVERALALTEGRHGAIARLGRAWAREPEARIDEVWRGLAGDDEPAPEGSADAASIAALIDAGSPRRALAQLARSSLDPLSRASLTARAALAAGRLEEALARFDEAAALAPASERLGHRVAAARVLERLGRHAEALARAEQLAGEATGPRRAEALAVLAQCALVRGDPGRAARAAADGAALLDETAEPALTAKLRALESDAALRTGAVARALALAESALRAAQRAGEPAIAAHATARIAAAHGLGGRPEEARQAWQAALAHAEASGDVAALPPYVANLATAEHATFHVAEAIAGYERAASLAERLGRVASGISARTNLGGLLAMLGADREALLVLERAEADARGEGEAPRAPLYLAQCRLLRAEVIGRRDAAAALALAREAKDAFIALGAGRQALEAELLLAELALAPGAAKEARSAARVFALRARASLEEAGLLPRASLLAARIALGEGDAAAAREAAELARAGGEPDLSLQASIVLVQAHERLETGEAPALLAEARRRRSELAARVPPGLRDAYLRAPERRLPEPEVRAVRSDRGLGAAGRRLLALVGRVLLPTDEHRVLEAALDEAIALTRAERAFLLLRKGGKRPEVMGARNLDKETIQKSRFRFSRSVAERVLETGEPLVTASATEDPSLSGARSVLDLGLRSILVVPVRARAGVIGALYVDHRFETARFADEDREIVQALADVIGLALENGRLHREVSRRADELAALSETLRAEALEREAELSRLSAERAAGEHESAPETGGIVGRAEALRRAIDLALKVARGELGVAIQGESGTGKELFARLVHDRSPRARGPFVAINCGALPESILESELFGHVRGAFTGAVRDHLGVFRAAAGGTVFLDEIGELPLGAQARLLRVLEAREVLPVGATRPTPTDVRVVCATNRDLAAEVEAGRFRRDLFFRLVGVTITVPPLRERKEDLPQLSAALLERIATEPAMRPARLSPAALRAVLAHDWPGNVRELLQALRRAVTVSEGELLAPADLGLPGSALERRSDAHRALDRQMLERALLAAGGSRTRAADALGITRVTLHRAMKRLGVDVPVKRGRPRERA